MEPPVNRQQRRRQAAISRQNEFYDTYVRHLPEVGPEVLAQPDVCHVVVSHDEWCAHYDGKACNCSPDIRFFAEPERS
jgi:hypothetical protein